MLRTQSPQNSSQLNAIPNMPVYERSEIETSDLVNSNEDVPHLSKGGQSRRQWRRRRLSRYAS